MIMHENLPFPAHRSTDESPPEETIGFAWFIIIYVSMFTQGSQVWIISGRKNKVLQVSQMALSENLAPPISMVYHGWSRLIMVYHNLPWFTMAYNGVNFTVVFHMVYSLQYHGLPWLTMLCHGLSIISCHFSLNQQKSGTKWGCHNMVQFLH